MRCSTCNEPIGAADVPAYGSDGVSHATCAKRATVHGKALDLMTAFTEIDRLKRRVQDLERQTEEHNGTLHRHAQNIPFRIGGD